MSGLMERHEKGFNHAQKFLKHSLMQVEACTASLGETAVTM